MTDKVKVEAPKKRGRPAKAKTEAVVKAAPAPAPAPKKVELVAGLEAKSGLWKIEEVRGDRVIVIPTPKHTKAFGRANITLEACKELFEV